MSQARDLFFDEFYQELERAVQELSPDQTDPRSPPILRDELLKHWNPHDPDTGDRADALISTDGGVQVSRYAYGGFVTVGRALALTHRPGGDTTVDKSVKIYIQEVHDERDRGLIPSYARTIAEYQATTAAARKALDEGLRPLILMDGSLHLARFPYATREYSHHPHLLTELFTSIADLRYLARDRGFPLVGITKDSTVFYLYMTFLRDTVGRSGLPERLAAEVRSASSPLDLRVRADGLPDGDLLQPFIESSPLCDTALVRDCTATTGYTAPLLLAPSSHLRDAQPSLHARIGRTLGPTASPPVINALTRFLQSPGVAVTYWKPQPLGRPFRVDLLATTLGHDESWGTRFSNRLADNHAPVEKILNHLAHWFCNDVEYNLPLKQADQLARFDRRLYTTKYEPFIVRRLEQAGVDVHGTRRNLREM